MHLVITVKAGNDIKNHLVHLTTDSKFNLVNFSIKMEKSFNYKLYDVFVLIFGIQYSDFANTEYAGAGIMTLIYRQIQGITGTPLHIHVHTAKIIF